MDEDELLRFCRLTLMSSDAETDLKVRLWLARIMDENAYTRKEDYVTGTFVWSMCLTPFEQEAFERYLWENGTTNFTFEVCGNKMKETLIAVREESE